MVGDLGISTYLTCSNYVKVENPKTLERYLKRLSKLQRRLLKRNIAVRIIMGYLIKL